MFLHLFNIDINVAVEDKLIKNYIFDRYRSFAFKKQNYVYPCKYLIQNIQSEELQKILNKSNISVTGELDCEIINNSESYVNVILKKSYLLYLKNENRIYLYINNITKNLKLFIAVQLCNIINYILLSEGISILHASAVTINNNHSYGISFVGDSGLGKTSIALKMVEAGEKMITDDLLYLNSYTMEGIKNTQFIGLQNDNLEKNFDYLKIAIEYDDVFEINKKRINLQKLKPDYYASSINIKDIFIIDSQKNEDILIQKVNKNLVFKYLLKNTMFLQGISHEPLINNIARILSKVNCYKLSPNNDVNITVAGIKNFYGEREK